MSNEVNMMLREKEELNHKCNCCGHIHKNVPNNARPMMDINNKEIEGWFWECNCLSTMFIKIKE